MSNNFELLPPVEKRQCELAEARSLSGVAVEAARAPINDSGFDILEPLLILFRRRVCIYVCAATCFAVAVLVCLIMPPKYVATSRIQLLSQEMGRLSLGEAGGGSDVFDFYATLQTDVTIMQSDMLALQVIKELDLADIEGDRAPLKRAAILKKFKANLYVDTVPGARMINVSYGDGDPEGAAKIVNQLVNDFVEYNFQVRFNATNKATGFLGRQLVDLKSEVEKSQERVVELQKASGMFGADESHNVVTTRLEQLNNEVITAEANRIAKEAVYNLASTENPELVAGLLGASATGTGSEVRNSLPLISHLRQEEADLNAQYTEALTKYGGAYPRLIQMKERLTALQSSIQTELNKVVLSAKSEYELAASQEATARKIFAEQKAVAAKMNDQAIAYTIAKHEADSSRVLYDNLLQRVKEAGVLAGLRSSDLNIVDPASVPGRPARPRVKLYLAVGVLIGLALGVASAFFFEAIDHRMRNPEEIETTTRAPVLGIIPRARISPATEPKLWLKAYGPHERRLERNTAESLSPDECAVAEAFRSVRTSLLLRRADELCKVIMIASAVPREGKSFAALNLAAALAQNGSRVLLVDGDLRRGTLSRVVNRPGVGLSEMLSGSYFTPYWGMNEVPGLGLDEVPGLIFLPAGNLLSSPAELLGSAKMAKMIEIWQREFSHVVIDTAPILPVTDAVVLAPYVDTVVVVARSGFTHRPSIVRAIRMLRDAQVKRILVLLNSVDVRSPEYYRAYGSYGYGGYNYGQSHLSPGRPSKPSP